MIEPKLIQWHLQYSNLGENDVAVEVGAGLGTLTKYLAEKARKIIAIESDPKLVEVLKKELSAYKNIELISGDALKVDQTIFAGTKIISNPPYKISSPLTFKIIRSSYHLAVLSFQKEFAERMVALPGSNNYSRIALGVNYYANVEYLKSIPKTYFYPIPKVDSALVRLTPRASPFQVENEKDFFEFVRDLFIFRKKTVKRALNLYLKNKNLSALKEDQLVNFSLANERIFRLSIQQFYELYLQIQQWKAP
jgi:16S rRNA (adenine1518-N6/adenine1519-N6)-dimethyltransferase